MRDDSEATLIGLIANAARVDRAAVMPGKRLREDVGIDSLSLIDLAIAAGDALGMPIPDEALERFQTVGGVADYVRRGKITA